MGEGCKQRVSLEWEGFISNDVQIIIPDPPIESEKNLGSSLSVEGPILNLSDRESIDDLIERGILRLQGEVLGLWHTYSGRAFCAIKLDDCWTDGDIHHRIVILDLPENYEDLFNFNEYTYH